MLSVMRVGISASSSSPRFMNKTIEMLSVTYLANLVVKALGCSSTPNQKRSAIQTLELPRPFAIARWLPSGEGIAHAIIISRSSSIVLI